MISENWLGGETSKDHYNKCIDNQPNGRNLIVKLSCISEEGGELDNYHSQFSQIFLGEWGVSLYSHPPEVKFTKLPVF